MLPTEQNCSPKEHPSQCCFVAPAKMTDDNYQTVTINFKIEEKHLGYLTAVAKLLQY
jgi:hypothetical protein